MIEDISTLQNMVKKRDSIIKELKEEKQVLPIISADTHLEAEITRLEEDLKLTKETNQSLFKACDQFKIDVEGLTKTVKDLEKQLDQECDSNAELEDKINNKEGTKGLLFQDIDDLKKDKEVLEEQIKDFDQINLKRIEQISVLEEKLALCDKHYKIEASRIADIRIILNRPD